MRKSKTKGQSACGSPSPIYHLLSSNHALGWWNGRHVRLRGVCRKACGFKSRPEHHRRLATEIPSSKPKSLRKAGTQEMVKV
jgi:hypothetical protein